MCLVERALDVMVALKSCVRRSTGMTCACVSGRKRKEARARLRSAAWQPHLQDLVDVLFKVEAEDAVRFVENKVLQRAQAEPLSRRRPWCA